jgi:hypothetical protein
MCVYEYVWVCVFVVVCWGVSVVYIKIYVVGVFHPALYQQTEKHNKTKQNTNKTKTRTAVLLGDAAQEAKVQQGQFALVRVGREQQKISRVGVRVHEAELEQLA